MLFNRMKKKCILETRGLSSSLCPLFFCKQSGSILSSTVFFLSFSLEAKLFSETDDEREKESSDKEERRRESTTRDGGK